MALVRCILGKFLDVVCHCFPPHLDLPIFAARRLHVRNNARDPSSERCNYERERSKSIYNFNNFIIYEYTANNSSDVYEFDNISDHVMFIFHIL